MRSLAVVLALCALAAVASAERPPKKAVVVERVVAVVNDTIILESELMQRVAPHAAELQDVSDPRERQRQWRQIVRAELDRMIEEELIVQAAAEANLDVTEEEVEKAIAEVKKQNRLTDEQFEQALRAQGYTMAQYRKDVRRQILQLRAVNVMVRPRVSVTDDEVREHYDRMVGRSAVVLEVKLAHILVALPERPTEADIADARRRAGELVSRARAGEDFGQLALAYSEEKSTKGDGGVLGWFKRGELPTDWEEIIFSMDKGDVRGPVRGPQGLHVFKVMDVKKDQVKPFEQVKDQIRAQLYNEELEKQTRVWLEELRKRAHVEVKL